jgi:L-amino acid N-acyltransferase YncA
VAGAGDVYTWPPDVTEAQARAMWTPASPGVVLVAVDADGAVLGSAKITPNQLGPGAHVANGSYVVADAARGRGVGRALGEASVAAARKAGFAAMQFNAVVEVNHAAVALWTSLGFEILATVPEAFDHPREGRVGLHIMHRRL